MKRFFCLQKIVFCHCENDITSGRDISISDGHDVVDLDALQVSARQGDVEEQLRLAECFYSGRYVMRRRNQLVSIRRDVGQAFYWWSRAAEQGNAKAQFWLGRCYWFGEGTDEDRTEACRWFVAAAEQGDEESIIWLQRAAEQGNRDAISFLRRHGHSFNDDH